MGTQEKARKGKGSSHEELSQGISSEKDRRIREDIERGRWAPDSYLKGWSQYTAESFSSNPFEQQEFLADFNRIDEIGDFET